MFFRSIVIAPKAFAKFAATKSFATYKTSTGLVGLAVDPDSRNTLLKLSGQVLSSVKKIPETSQYRINVEKWFNYISKAATDSEDVKAIEDEIELGQLEEVIEMAKDELTTIDFYYENRGWLLVEDAKKDADAVIDRMKDSLYFTQPQAAPK